LATHGLGFDVLVSEGPPARGIHLLGGPVDSDEVLNGEFAVSVFVRHEKHLVGHFAGKFESKFHVQKLKLAPVERREAAPAVLLPLRNQVAWVIALLRVDVLRVLQHKPHVVRHAVPALDIQVRLGPLQQLESRD
jgi:hypothetical protein